MTPRIIARLDIKNATLIKGIQLEGLRVLGKPAEFAKQYYDQGIDEILYLDSVASLYNRDYLPALIEQTAKEVFVPITVGGGIKTCEDVELILRSGADKVAINTAAVKNPSLIREVANSFGSQCMVLQVDVKKTKIGHEIYIDGGREHTNLVVEDWIKIGQNLGCGEVLLTSIDKDGTRRGFDLDLISKVKSLCKVPLIVSSGCGKLEDLDTLGNFCGIDAIAIGSAFHYSNLSVGDVKSYFSNG